MSRLSYMIRHPYQCTFMLVTLLVDAARFLRVSLRSPAVLAAENLFLRKQLGLYQERHVKPRHASHATRITLLWLSPWFDWHRALVVVQPEAFMRWQRQGFQLFRLWTSCPGRPPIPAERQGLIRQMARENLTGANGASPTNCGSNWAYGSLHVRFASTCPGISIERQAPKPGCEPDGSMASSGMMKRSDGIIAHHT